MIAADEGAKLYFYVPMSLLVCINLLLFGLTTIEILHYQRELELRQLAANNQSEQQQHQNFQHLKRIIFICLGLFFLMGVNWLIELISWWVGGNPFVWSAFDVINALQGVLIFGLFILHQPVRFLLWRNIEQKFRNHHHTFQDKENYDKLDISKQTTLFLLGIINNSNHENTM